MDSRTHIGQIVFHLVVSADVVAENGMMFQLDGDQTVLCWPPVVVDGVDALVEVSVLVQIASQYSRRYLGRRIDHWNRNR